MDDGFGLVKEQASRSISETPPVQMPSFSGWAYSVHHDSIPVPIQRQQQVAVDG